MRLVLTGGGTGGHIYPALEVGRTAADNGAELLYLGSHRGQEGVICRDRGIAFHAFGSAPLYSLKSPKGWKSLVGLLRATHDAKRHLRAARPNAVFSTGGYSAAPIMAAARSLGIPYVIYEANSIPGRSNLMFAPRASAFACLFHRTQRDHPKAVRTGSPIRRELRNAAAARDDGEPLVLVLGGSQGSAFLNELVPLACDGSIRVIHAVGRAHYEAFANRSLPDHYEPVPYLETGRLADAYRKATVAVARSGSTVAEFAMFGLPSILIPLPTAADQHQLHNAKEFVDMSASTLLEQDQASPAHLAQEIQAWLRSPERREVARKSLLEWDVPDATDRLFRLVQEAAR